MKSFFAASVVSLSVLTAPAPGQNAEPKADLIAPAQATIDKIAPENTVVLVGVKNVAASMERMKRTSLWALWEDEKLKKLREEQVQKFTEQLHKQLEELGVEKDALAAPTGDVGLAVFPITNTETGMPEAAFLLRADYGENADKTDALIQAALARGEKDGDLEVDHKDVAGRTIYTIDASKLEEKTRKAAEAAQDADEGEGLDLKLPPGVPDPQDVMGGFTKMHYVRDGNAFMLSNQIASLTDALDMVDAKGGKSITERADYQAIMNTVGEQDMHAVILTRDVMELMSSGGDQMMMAQMMVPMIRAAFGRVHGYGLGWRLDGASAMVEQTFTAYMPDGKAGLTTLVDTPTPRGPLPPFIGPQTVTYASINFEFAELMDVIRKVVDSIPMLKAQAAEQIDLIDQGVRQITATLGTQVHFATTVSKPITEASIKSVWAIQCAKPQEFENLFAEWASQIGLESRDFLGQRIYSMKPEMMQMMPGGGGISEPMSLGIGGGFVLIGPTPGVEQALRSTSESGLASLGSEPSFQRAVAALPPEPAVAWGYSNTIDSAEVAFKMRKAADLRTVEEIKQFDPEMAADYQKRLEEQYKIFDAIDFELLRKYLGATVWQVRANDDGFVGTAYMVAPASAPAPER